MKTEIETKYSHGNRKLYSSIEDQLNVHISGWLSWIEFKMVSTSSWGFSKHTDIATGIFKKRFLQSLV